MQVGEKRLIALDGRFHWWVSQAALVIWLVYEISQVYKFWNFILFWFLYYKHNYELLWHKFIFCPLELQFPIGYIPTMSIWFRDDWGCLVCLILNKSLVICSLDMHPQGIFAGWKAHVNPVVAWQQLSWLWTESLQEFLMPQLVDIIFGCAWVQEACEIFQFLHLKERVPPVNVIQEGNQL